MNCLRDYIGIRGCGITPPVSGIYVNTLPGIEFKGIEDLANADQVSFQGVWDDVQDRAIERFSLDVIGELSGFDDRYRLRQVTQTVDLGRELGDNVAVSANQSGFVIELNNPGDQFVCSNMQTLYVQSVSFYSVAGGAYTLIVKNADLGTTLDTLIGTATVGWNTVETDCFYDAQRVSITQDTSAISTATLDLSQFNLSGFNNTIWNNDYWGFNGALWFNYGCSGSAQVRGYQTDLSYQNPVYGQNTFGISCVFSVRCTYNNVVCKNKRYFAPAWRLCLGIELMEERLSTSRINKWTTVDYKQAQRLKGKFEAMYRGGEFKDGDFSSFYEGELKKACNSIDLDLTDCCLECDANLQWRETQL